LFGQIGMNACGLEFHERLIHMYEAIVGTLDLDMEQFLNDEGWLDSDFDKYDKRLLVLTFAVYVLWLIVCETPCYKDNPIEKNRVKLILQSLQQFIVIIENEVILMDKRLPSGVFGTAWINCIAECIIEILQFYYCFAVAYGRPLVGNFVLDGIRVINFFSVVSLINFGDDNLKFVNRSFRGIYTHENISLFSKFICMGITPAHKTESRIEFKKVTDILFLKRTPVFIPRLRLLVGRLEFTSIGKMLAFTDSNDASWYAMVMNQARRELSCYPKNVIDLFKQLFEEQFDEDKVLDEVLSTREWFKPQDDNIVEYDVGQEFTTQEKEAEPGLTKQADV